MCAQQSEVIANTSGSAYASVYPASPLVFLENLWWSLLLAKLGLHAEVPLLPSLLVRVVRVHDSGLEAVVLGLQPSMETRGQSQIFGTLYKTSISSPRESLGTWSGLYPKEREMLSSCLVPR